MKKDNGSFDGLGLHLGNIARLSDAETRSISAENPDGSRGKGGMATEGLGAEAARDLGQGWKIAPCIEIEPNSTVEIADIKGSGAITHIWLTVHPDFWRRLIFRFYWDGEKKPSVEVPLGDFFCNGWCERSNVDSLPIAVCPAGGFNSYWEMPFRKSARVTVENVSDYKVPSLYYQIDYTLTDVPNDRAYLHAQWRRSNPLKYKEVHTILDGVHGRGHYVGTYIAWGSNNEGWWGEGEVKFFIDGDGEWPTICGTGTEDYFGGAWCFEEPKGKYGVFSTPFLGMNQVIEPDGFFKSQQRFGLYRWHVPDPIRFKQDLRVTIQALGWYITPDKTPKYLPLQDDIASTAFWYQAEPHATFPVLPEPHCLEVV
ncbi:MAG: glycoside hydrolase family 172 protein [Planctomycetota bacterium]|jgi:hypothetical protein